MFGLFKRRAQLSEGTSSAIAERQVVDVSDALETIDGIPVFTGAAMNVVLAKLPDFASDEEFAQELTAASRSWLKTLNEQAFDGRLKSGESKRFILLGDVDDARGRAILAFAESTLERLERDLNGIVWFGPASKFPIFAFASQDDYYRYVATYFPAGEFGGSSGMFLKRSLGHFVFPYEEMWILEAVIAHELFHAVVAHLPLPAWLNEGLASNAEFRYGNRVQDPRHVDDQLPHHRRYWNAERLQKFWSGEAFFNTDEGQELSYDLARRLVVGLSSDWKLMTRFILQADLRDAGEGASHEVFGFSLAIPVEVITGQEGNAPIPTQWASDPFGGGYDGTTVASTADDKERKDYEQS